jgi:hypothetical protein
MPVIERRVSWPYSGGITVGEAPVWQEDWSLDTGLAERRVASVEDALHWATPSSQRRS